MFIRTCGGTSQRLCDAGEIDDDGLNAVAFAFNLGGNTFHLVTIEGIGDILQLSVRELVTEKKRSLPCEC